MVATTITQERGPIPMVPEREPKSILQTSTKEIRVGVSKSLVAFLVGQTTIRIVHGQVLTRSPRIRLRCYWLRPSSEPSGIGTRRMRPQELHATSRSLLRTAPSLLYTNGWHKCYEPKNLNCSSHVCFGFFHILWFTPLEKFFYLVRFDI